MYPLCEVGVQSTCMGSTGGSGALPRRCLFFFSLRCRLLRGPRCGHVPQIHPAGSAGPPRGVFGGGEMEFNGGLVVAVGGAAYGGENRRGENRERQSEGRWVEAHGGRYHFAGGRGARVLGNPRTLRLRIAVGEALDPGPLCGARQKQAEGGRDSVATSSCNSSPQPEMYSVPCFTIDF